MLIVFLLLSKRESSRIKWTYFFLLAKELLLLDKELNSFSSKKGFWDELELSDLVLNLAETLLFPKYSSCAAAACKDGLGDNLGVSDGNFRIDDLDTLLSGF